MTVALDPGHVFDGSALIEMAAQSSATITAPVTNPRIDRIVIDQFTGVLSVVTGIESASPTPPAIPSGKNPVAQVLLQTSSTAITNGMITDERDFSFLGGGISGISAGVGLTGGGSSGAVTLALSVPVAVANGGTGATAAGATAATNIGALAQANNLSDLASASTALANLGGLAQTANLSDLANAATGRGNLGLGTIATQNANAVAITGGTITGLPTPSAAMDAATKAYVDAVASGLSVRASVAIATTAALPFTPAYNNGSSGVGATLTASSNGALAIDGYTTQANDRILVKDQALPEQNGIYVVTAPGSVSSAYILTRAVDANSATNILPGLFAFVVGGAINQGAGFVLITIGGITVGATPLPFSQFSGAGAITAGTGLAKSGNVLSLAVPVSVSNGGTGLSAAPSNAVLTTNNLGATTWTSLAANGQILIGATSGSPSAATLTAGPGIAITNGANSVTVTNSFVPWNHIAGFALSNAGPTSLIVNVAPGQAADSTNAAMILLNSAANVDFSTSGPGGLQPGATYTVGAWYALFVLGGSAATKIMAVPAVSGTAVAPTLPLPSGYSFYRYIGSVNAVASNAIAQFKQSGNVFFWGTQQTVLNSTIGTTGTPLVALNLPLGVKVQPLYRLISNTTNVNILVTSPDEPNLAPSGAAFPSTAAPLQDQVSRSTSGPAAIPFLLTDLTGSIRARSSASVSVFIYVRGWIDPLVATI